MTNFNNPKPYIDENKFHPTRERIDRREAVEKAVEIIRENKRIVAAANKTSNENPHR